jgi:hypothetical protein
MFDVTYCRQQFPALARRPGAVFLDGPGGTQVPQRVLDAITGYLTHSNANHGGVFATSQESDRILHRAHEAVCDLLNAPSPDEIVFGGNMTSLTLHFTRSVARTLRPGDEVLVTRLDHDASVSPWLLAARDTNPVLQRATAQALVDVELYYHHYGYREPHLQRFEDISSYRADSWRQARRVVAKIEITPQGSQRRFVVTNLQAPPQVVYRQVYTQRGAVPEQPISEMKNGLRCERLSSSGFCANAFRLLVHAVAYAIVVLFREATAGVPEVATATVSTLRQKLWKVGAVLRTSAWRVWLHVSARWPGQALWRQVHEAVARFVAQGPAAGQAAATG